MRRRTSFEAMFDLLAVLPHGQATTRIAAAQARDAAICLRIAVLSHHAQVMTAWVRTRARSNREARSERHQKLAWRHSLRMPYAGDREAA